MEMSREAIADNGGGEFQVTAGRTKDNVAEDHVITIVEDHPIVAGFNVGDDVTISTGHTEGWWSTGQQAPGSKSLASALNFLAELYNLEAKSSSSISRHIFNT